VKLEKVEKIAVKVSTAADYPEKLFEKSRQKMCPKILILKTHK
jgi:hypothetical protein